MHRSSCSQFSTALHTPCGCPGQPIFGLPADVPNVEGLTLRSTAKAKIHRRGVNRGTLKTTYKTSSYLKFEANDHAFPPTATLDVGLVGFPTGALLWDPCRFLGEDPSDAGRPKNIPETKPWLIMLLEEIRRSPPGMYKSIVNKGDKLPINWLAGFLPSTVLAVFLVT